MKIKKISIKNFKVFQNINIDFEDANLILFDGPNGFGKTSLYDAIELLFTGEIRRFKTLAPLVIDNRESFNEHPFLCDYADGDISITIEFSKNQSNYILSREALREDLNNKIDFSIYKLYTQESFIAEEKSLIENEEEFLNELLGSDYKQNFHFLNYIEQEDSLFLLKDKDKNRKSNISHLFNVSEFEDKIAKLDILKKKITELCDSKIELEISELKKSIQHIENILKNEFKNTDYLKLFPEKTISWDTETFDFTDYSFENLFYEDGIVTKLKKLVERKDSFKNYIKNSKIERLIQDKENTENFLLFYNFSDRRKELLEQKIEIEYYKEIVETLTDFSIEDIKNKVIDSKLIDYDFIDDSSKSKFKDDLINIQSNIQELDELEAIYLRIKESREKLIENIEKLKKEEKVVNKGICFLCGYNWGDIDILLASIEEQTSSLEILTSSKNKKIEEDFSAFKQWILNVIIPFFNPKLEENKLDLNFVEKLNSIDENLFNTIKSDFEKINFNYKEYLNTQIDISIGTDFTNIIVPQLETLKSEVETSEIQSYFSELYAIYFDNSSDKLEAFSLENIIQKEDFLKYKYATLQNQMLETKKQELTSKEIKLENAKKIEKKLKDLKTIFSNSLREYNQKVIKDIEIIFHIYSGRIMQDFQGGLGLFIFSDKDGIRFQTNPTKTFDAIFSMSSGQLSALIISFTLALHKKYSQNKIILIDDPVQTMDEINIVGFIDLLRNEFNTNQIIVSTHEDMASAFMRYKFKNYGLNQKRINLKLLK
ncbi:AAA family ATPase [Empedobacter falsenii]